MRPPPKIVSRDDIIPSSSAQNHTSNILLWQREPTNAPILQILPSHNHYGIKLKIKKACGWLSKSAWFIATLGRASTAYKTHKYVPSTFNIGASYSEHISISTAQWEQVLQDLKKEWKFSSLGCALIMPLSATLLQIDAVFDDILGRTAAIAAFIFSVVGLVLSVSFTLNFRHFGDGKCRNEWVKASGSFSDLKSVEFWSLLAFPMSLLIWSMIICVATILILAWNLQDGSLLSDSVWASGHTRRAGNIISATIPMILTVILSASLCRCRIISGRLL